MESLEKEDILKKIYYNSASDGSFGGVRALYRKAKEIIPNFKENEVRDWLSGELVYTLHKPVRRHFKRNKVLASKPFENMQADLVDMREFSKNNDGHNYILTAIDVFSKIGFAIAIKAKSLKDVCVAMETVFKKHKPFKLMTDEGKEFDNSGFKKLCEDYEVHHYFAKNKEVKCSIVERFNKTLKNKMFRYFTLKGNRRYIDKLDEFLNSYNNSYHQSIKMKPSHVTLANANLVFKNIYGYPNKREYLRHMIKPKLSPGDTVRKKYDLKIHDRGYYPYWTDEIYKIYKSMSGKAKPYYQIEDEQGNIKPKRFYPEEIQKVKPTLYRVEEVLKERKYKGKKQYFVKWLNHPESQNSWIPAEDLTNINGEK